MKILLGMIAYNEEYLINASLESVFDFIDKGVVIDGSPTGTSTDKTAEIIKRFSSKIDYYSGSYSNKKDQRNEYINCLQPYIDDDTWLFMVDADEIWKKEDLGMIKDLMINAESHINAIFFKHIHFWRDFKHYITGGLFDKWLYRINRLKKGYRYAVHSSLGNEWGRSLDDPKHAIIIDRAICYHGGHAQTREKQYYRWLYFSTMKETRMAE